MSESGVGRGSQVQEGPGSGGGPEFDLETSFWQLWSMVTLTRQPIWLRTSSQRKTLESCTHCGVRRRPPALCPRTSLGFARVQIMQLSCCTLFCYEQASLSKDNPFCISRKHSSSCILTRDPCEIWPRIFVDRWRRVWRKCASRAGGWRWPICRISEGLWTEGASGRDKSRNSTKTWTCRIFEETLREVTPGE